MNTNPSRVDIHHHILPPDYVAAHRQDIADIAAEFAPQVLGWSVARSLDAMDAAGVSADEYSSPTNTAMWSVLQLFAKANANMSDDPTKDETLAAKTAILYPILLPDRTELSPTHR